MTPKERAAMQQALKAMKDASPYGLTFKEAIIACEEALEQHKPHEECECSACLNYFTDKAHEEALAIRCQGCDYCNNPLFAGTKCNNCGLVTLAEQAEPNSTFMEGYRIGLAEMREKCATVSEQGTGEAVQKTALELLLNERKRIAAAIRAIKFEGDTGFRPVSEMVAEHKQDPKKAAAIEKARERLANKLDIVNQEPVAQYEMLTDDEIQMLWVNWDANRTSEWYECIEDLVHVVEDYIKEKQAGTYIDEEKN